MICAAVERCAGIDVGKQTLSVCIMVGPLEGQPQVVKSQFLTLHADLIRLREWLKQERITHVVMESTGPYWRPIFNLLEDAFVVVLANGEQVKARRGHKTDWKDCAGLADLLRHEMIRVRVSYRHAP